MVSWVFPHGKEMDVHDCILYLSHYFSDKKASRICPTNLPDDITMSALGATNCWGDEVECVLFIFFSGILSHCLTYIDNPVMIVQVLNNQISYKTFEMDLIKNVKVVTFSWMLDKIDKMWVPFHGHKANGVNLLCSRGKVVYFRGFYKNVFEECFQFWSAMLKCI